MAEESNVHVLPGCKLPDAGEPPERVVRLLRLMLERAERGEIAGLAYASVAPSGAVTTGWRFGAAKDSDLTMAAQALSQRMLANWAES